MPILVQETLNFLVVSHGIFMLLAGPCAAPDTAGSSFFQNRFFWQWH